MNIFRRIILALLLILAISNHSIVKGENTTIISTDSIYPSRQSVGLVLSGGGAKGIAHIGVIQALEDHNIPIDFVAGTSMGAIVGGLYACGYTPQEMMELILSPGFGAWSTGQVDPNLTYYFLRQPQTPAFAHINVNVNRADSTASNSIMPSSLISPLPMNFAFMELFAAYTAQCGKDFNNLFVPFRCVCSDVVAKHKLVLSQGMLSDAIRASMSFPAVFEPIKLNGTEVYDGGIYDNFPVDVMREDFAPDIMIGVDVHSENITPSNSIVTQLENMIIQNNDYSLPADEGIRIHVDVSQFSLLDFGKAKEIYAIGYRRAMEMMDSVEGRVISRIPPQTRRLQRAMFKSASPYVRFDSVKVSGGTPSQNDFIAKLFENQKHHTDTFGIDKARLAYYRALSPGKLRNLFPQAHYEPDNGLFTLDLDADFKNNFAVGAGGYLTSSVNSMIFMSASYSSMSFSSWSTRAMGWIGQSYMAAQIDGELYLTQNTPSALTIEGVYSRQKYFESDKLFFQVNSPAFVQHSQLFARINYGWALGRRGKAMIGVGGGRNRNRYFSQINLDDGQPAPEETRMNLLEAIFRLDYNTLDNESYPSAGSRLRLTALQTLGKYRQWRTTATREAPPEPFSNDQRWFQAEVQFEHYFLAGKHFSLGANASALVSNRKLLNTYYATLVNAPDYSPLISMSSVFNKAFRANSFVAAGITPIWRPFQRAQVRMTGQLFLPFRALEAQPDNLTAHYGRWLSDPQFAAELALVYNLPFASVCGYVDYLSYPARNWSVGLSFGLFFTANKFLR